ncbi:MAG: hypothetical protein V5A51_12340, partial [Bacteroidales bacterium]
MKRKPLRILIFIVLVALVVGGMYWYYSHYRFTREAQQILQETEVEGGLIVHLGFENSKVTAAFHAGDRYLVHGITPDKSKAKKAREYMYEQGIYGNVSVEHRNKETLPYTDNLVNLIVAEDTGNISMDEMMRVLAPEGVAF